MKFKCPWMDDDWNKYLNKKNTWLDWKKKQFLQYQDFKSRQNGKMIFLYYANKL